MENKRYINNSIFQIMKDNHFLNNKRIQSQFKDNF